MGECKIDLLTLNHTGLNDDGLMQAASIPKLTHIQIDHTAVTYEGLINIAEHTRIEPVSKEQFTQEQMETFSNLQREKAKKSVKLDQQAVEECQKILKDFFEAMTVWEKYVSEKGFEDEEVNSRLLNIWEQYVSEKPRLGYRPLALSYSPTGTYSQEVFIDAEQLTKNKIYVYTKTKNKWIMTHFWNKWKSRNSRCLHQMNGLIYVVVDVEPCFLGEMGWTTLCTCTILKARKRRINPSIWKN